jgi:hypothetical protein
MRRYDTPHLPKHPLVLSPEMRELLRNRTMPFLNDSGVATRPLSFLLEEVYLQGMRDAAQAMEGS